MLVERLIAGVRPPSAFVDRSAFLPDYPFGDATIGMLLSQTLVGDHEVIAPDYLSFVRSAYKANPIVFGAIATRLQLFREARVQWRQMRDGKPGDLFGSPELGILEKPWPGGSTGDILAIAEVAGSIGGNFFMARRPARGRDAADHTKDRIRIMRPDWTRIILGSTEDTEGDDKVGPLDLDAEIIGYAYWNGGVMTGKPDYILFPEQVCHWAPLPDPEAPYRGMSWMTPIIHEILADKAMTKHKQKFLEGGATPNLAVKLNVTSVDEFNKWVTRYREERELTDVDSNPYRTLFLAAAADPVPIGSNLKDTDWSAVQSGGEVRIAVAAGVHPVVLGIQAGLQGSALNAGNFEAAYRQFANGTTRPNWRSFFQAASVIVDRPTFSDGKTDDSSELWYDDHDIPALAEDTVRAAEIASSDASTISTLIMAGFDPSLTVEAVVGKDLGRLAAPEAHTGLPSVQLQPAPASTKNGSRAELAAGALQEEPS